MTKMNSDTTNRPDSAAFAVEAGRLLQDRHCEDVLLLDVTGLSQVCDYVLIATGTSDRQMKSVSDEVADLGEEMKFPAFRKNIDTGATWIVVDFITVV
jgi:ribosome-associated protein